MSTMTKFDHRLLDPAVARALSALRNPDDAACLRGWDLLVRDYGQERAGAAWSSACRMLDAEEAS